ncbi:hypothetical protein CA850_23435 [Micromonospora echinospora]|nr:hypothetical protein CA850_23435 [Micromonospora echinospora]
MEYAAWQRDRLDGPATGDGFAYWTRTLAGVPALKLPTDRPRPAVQSYAGGTHRFALDADLTDGPRRLSRAHRAILYMTLLTGLQAVLFRHSGQRDFAIGSPVAGRVVPELENLVGLFVNTLALRAHLCPVAATADTARVARRLPVRSCVAFALVAGIRPRDCDTPRMRDLRTAEPDQPVDQLDAGTAAFA